MASGYRDPRRRKVASTLYRQSSGTAKASAASPASPRASSLGARRLVSEPARAAFLRRGSHASAQVDRPGRNSDTGCEGPHNPGFATADRLAYRGLRPGRAANQPTIVRNMRIAEVIVSHYRGWREPVSWRPTRQALLVGPNNAGKTSLLTATDLVLNPYRDAYRDRLTVWDYPDCDTSQPVSVTVVLEDLSDNDRDHFEPYLEGRRDDGSFGGWDSPEEEFDHAQLVLRLAFRGVYGEPSRAFFGRPEAGEASVRQADKIRIGWRYVPAGLDPGHELAFYSNSVLSRLFERDDLAAPLDQIRQAIDAAKGPLLSHPTVADARAQLQSSAQQLGLAPPGEPLDLTVAGLSDRRVLQSLQLVLRGDRGASHLPLAAHGRGVLRVLLLAALLQDSRASEGNLILAVEEPEQNLEPVNQRLVTRSLLLADDSGAHQILLTTHSAEVTGVVPLAEVHLARETPSGPELRALSQAIQPEHKFFELHSRAALVDGLYASVVVLAEGPTERGAFPVLWSAQRPGSGLDEHRIELVDCESIDKMPSFVRFYRALGIPVVAVIDTDKPRAVTEVEAAAPDVVLRWTTHGDWEGVLAAEAEVGELASAMEACRSMVGPWQDHADQLRACLADRVGAADHLAGATGIPGLVAGYSESDARSALACLLRGKAGIDFKSTMYARTICEALTAVPPTVARMIDHVHRFTAGDATVAGVNDL
jgi:putative ATP-dependent endonuclease of the OLD family